MLSGFYRVSATASKAFQQCTSHAIRIQGENGTAPDEPERLSVVTEHPAAGVATPGDTLSDRQRLCFTLGSAPLPDSLTNRLTKIVDGTVQNLGNHVPDADAVCWDARFISVQAIFRKFEATELPLC
jgi:hypothetical protein